MGVEISILSRGQLSFDSTKVGVDTARERNAKRSLRCEVWHVSLMFVQSNVESFSILNFAFSIIDSRRVFLG